MNKFYAEFLFAAVLIIAFGSCKKATNLDVRVPADTATVKPVVVTKPSAPKTIVVIGSSTAAGFGASCGDSSWVNRLNSAVTASKQGSIINLSVPGFSTYDVMPTGYAPKANRSYPSVNNNVTKALSYHPDFIIVNLPTNDIACGYSDAEIISNFKTITALMDSLKVPYILTGTQPRNFPAQAARQRLKTLNDELNNVFNGHVDDYLNTLSDETWNIKPQYNSGDGTHVNNTGHRLIYQSFLNFSLFVKLLNA